MIYKELVEWIETLPYWQRKVSEQIINGCSFQEEDYAKIYDIFKIEMGLTNQALVEERISFPNRNSNDTEGGSLCWKGVQNVKGVNALKSGEALVVANGLTLVYGENGSGKSGYTRLFNNAFISKGDKTLLHNVYEEQPDKEYAEFLFVKEDDEFTLLYPENKGAEEFRRIMVFDTESAEQDMRNESELSFVPEEFKFFDQLLIVCNEIEKRLEQDINEHKHDNPFLVFFERKSVIRDAVENLNAKTDFEQLSEYRLSVEEKEQFETLKKEKAKLISLNIADRCKKLNKINADISKINNTIQLIGKLFKKEYLAELNVLLKDYKAAELLVQSEGIEQFSDEQIENLGSKEWKEFLIAAKKYYNSIGHSVEKCIFCGQDIKNVEVIDKYWLYLESVAEKRLSSLKHTVVEKIKLYGDINVDLPDEGSICGEWLIANCEQEYSLLKNEFDNVDKIKNKILAVLESKVWDDEICEISITQKNVTIMEACIKEEIEGLNAEEISKKIKDYSTEEEILKDREKLVQLLPQVKAYIEEQKWISDAEKKKIKTRIITNKQKELFTKYITEDYIAAFDEECKKLNANFNAEIVQRGSKGVTLKKIAIKGITPGSILSEGEQRAICIANFLAEVKMNPNNVAVIFDDPVSSLDHLRRHDISARLIEESQKRQVVIFTHDITFLMEIKTLCDDQNIEFEMQTIRKIANRPGNITRAIPWQGMNVKERIKKLNFDLQNLQKVEKSGDVDEYFYRAKAWCELLRESWERSVEEILLNDAIQRYNPCVQTQRLAKAPFTQDLYREVEKGMSECSSWVHDRARALNAEVPTTDILRGYINTFDAFVKANRK